MASADLNQRDARLVAWLGEAHAKEAELEADLTAHISLTQKDSYRKRLQDHLKETRDHKRQVERRIKALGGSVNGGGSGGIAGAIPNPVGVAGEMAGKTVSLVKGQIGTVRAAVTEQVETHLRNAQEELREEHVEIALYTRIERFAQEVGDKETARLAAGIRRQEERMAKFLDAELGRLVKELVRKEIPREERAAPKRSASRASSRARSAGSTASKSSRATSSSSGSAKSSRSSATKSTRSRPAKSTGSGSAKSTRSGSAKAATRSRSGSR